MATTTAYPTALDSFTQHSQGDYWGPGQNHTDSHNTLETAVLALETKIGAVSSSYGSVKFAEGTFTETSGAGVYTWRCTVPAGAWLIEVLVHGVAVWDNAGAVDMQVGDAAVAGAEIDQNGIFVITSLKAAGDLIAGETLGASGVAGSAGGEVGADLANSDWSRRYLGTARDIVGIITTASTGGSTGRTRMLVVWAESTSATATAATKV